MKFSLQSLQDLWNNKWLFGAVLSFFSAVLALILANLSTFENFEFTTYDARFGLRGQMETTQDDVVLVTIDDESFIGLGNWPFPRVLFAEAILNLHDAGAKLIVMDIEFTEPNKQDPRQDQVLAGAVLRAQDVILAGKWVTEFAINDIVNTYVIPPIKALRNTRARWGLVNVDEDPDGFIRRYLLFQTRNNQYFYTLALEALLHLNSAQNGKAGRNEDGYFVIAGRRIPKKDYNSMLINFRGPAESFPTYSLAAVLDDADFDLLGDEDTDIFEIHKETGTFKDKIVFIGAAAEELEDTKFTPFFGYKGVKRKMPGVELHAHALSTLLRGDFIKTESPVLGLIMVFVLSGLTMVVTKWLQPFRGMFAVLGIVLAYVIWGVYAFLNLLVWVEITAPLTAIVLSYVGNVVHQTLTEQRERIRIKKTWQHFMSGNVIDSMLDSGKLPTFGGERRELTVLFSDIRGFTTFSEKHSSQQVVQKLNEYLTSMVDVIFKYAGTLDKFVGDEIMAVYGAPHPYRNHAENACLTAVEMVARLRRLQRKWSARKQAFFQIGIGINTGKVIIGNLGSQQLFDYTVIGDDVNLGARLEGANKQYGTTIIISEATYKAVRKRAIVRELDMVRVKGKNRPVRIYELRGMRSLPRIERELIIDVYTQGLNYYKELKWYQALTQFKRVLRYFPTDGPSRVYIKRCLDFIENPPPENWDGVYEFTTK
ncbi:adenylate/guanylate cyclase domain-containing protein [candidate division KSB1 bacterium]|nr:adenylate/guanylate cyclase domain-containing protein [candidate division KSB1 bacterium]NIR69566.1 adenylate/guanylate cyclase domain-containing protein [candidate division KSB1 bacterium]NIS25914.1 adenylate/guanylate cyclase domain-containing protein [candidate division KSB1 bacterium]NIT72795.1 adenylate/guanylate cyclase domain-containing protein [candidate division KSB1 bacterium]NIU26602.1 adenylate/guanylate cyclase domain-containing protein [candidate division KSB1 bacterium]